MKTPKLLLSVLLLVSFFATAQETGSIDGTIRSEGQPAASVVVVLLSAEAKTIVRTELTDTNGTFRFSGLPNDGYLLSVEDPSYSSYQSSLVAIDDAHRSVSLPTIELQKAAVTNLQEVTVVRRKPLIENKIDKVVVNVDALMSAAGGDAMDVLEKSPGIVIDQNGTITYKGKSGLSVFIDGKPSYLSGADLEAFLKSLPAATLNQVELMTNPPAKYDAAGGGGIINITTKKTNSRGFNGSVSARLTQGKRFRGRENLNLNYLGDNVRIFGSAGVDYTASVNDLDIYRRFKDEDGTVVRYFDQNSILENKARSGNARAGIDYYASDKTTFGAMVFGLYRESTVESDVNSVLRNAARALDSTVVARNRNEVPFRNLTFNLNMRHDFADGAKWTADADYLLYRTETDQRFRNFVYGPDGQERNQDESKGYLPSDIDIVSLKTDYSRQFKNGLSFETGYKVSLSKTDNIADYRDAIGGVFVPNYDQSNHFRYDETIHAGYVNGSRAFGRIAVQAGLRLENTDSKGNQLGNPEKPASRFRRNYTNLFPTLYVQYQLDSIGNHVLVTSYGKRINRPYYEDLNPFVSPLDKFTFYAGNPYLNPSFAHNVELSYRYKGYFSTTASYGFTRDDINETIEITDGIYYSRPGNIGQSRFYSLNANAQIPFTKWWTSNLYAELTRTEYESRLYTETLDASGTFCVFNATNTFILPSDWSVEVSGYYQSNIVSSQFVLLERGGVNLAVQHKLWKGKGSVKLIGNDLFYTGINRGIINNLANVNANWTNKPDSRFVSLALNYSFGKAFETPKAYDANGAESEKSRVKT
ncbi:MULTISPECIES: outer membrane beta-barrel family protein [unclassified Flavobacterium]|uniref:outer membrane beta-barrel family protein n=1 Tax=unclassified Flavobacterium TaxID=196869 RepID=UPI001F145600|nr:MULTISPECIES: outer membrane beta-barrel family protein [unclassified Flavobacterium]UMY64451.1 TonB-dependent receptor [Flavobacterium sp. HJ-32-4]